MTITAPEAALWAVASAGRLEQASILFVGLSEDLGTGDAVTGVLSGAKWGEPTIPKRWLAPLAWRQKLGAVALGLIRTSSQAHRGKA